MSKELISKLCDIPKKCPTCGTDLVLKGADLVCPNPNCESKNYNRLYNWIKYTSAVKGVSTAGVNEFIEIFGFTSVLDIYNRFSKDKCLDILDHTAVGEVTRIKYKEMIDWLFIDQMDFRYFITGLNLPGVGWTTACSINDNPVVVEMLCCGTGPNGEIIYDSSEIMNELYKVSGIGYQTVEAIMHEIELIDALCNKIRVIPYVEKKKSTLTNTRYFCITGSINYGSRSELCEYVKQFGWEMADIKNAEFLVTNNPDPASNKGKKAKALNKPIITEDQFMKIVKGE